MNSLIEEDVRTSPDPVAKSFDAEPRIVEHDEDQMPAGRPPVHAPWSIRVCLWCVYLVRHVTVVGLIRAFSRILRRPLVWFLMQYLKLYGLVSALTGGRIGGDEYEERMDECDACPGQEKTRRGKRYCGPCGCPRWFMSELARKNRWRRHYCPEKRHTRTEYPKFITISPAGCGQKAFTVPAGPSRNGGQTNG